MLCWTRLVNGTWGGQVARELLNADVRELGTGTRRSGRALDVPADLLEDLAEPSAASLWPVGDLAGSQRTTRCGLPPMIGQCSIRRYSDRKVISA
jgi:hypothetical protein